MVPAFLGLHQVDESVFQVLWIEGKWVQRISAVRWLVLLDRALNFLMQFLIDFLAHDNEFRLLWDWERNLLVKALYDKSLLLWLFLFRLLLSLVLVSPDLYPGRVSSMDLIIVHFTFANPWCRFALFLISFGKPIFFVTGVIFYIFLRWVRADTLFASYTLHLWLLCWFTNCSYRCL